MTDLTYNLRLAFHSLNYQLNGEPTGINVKITKINGKYFIPTIAINRCEVLLRNSTIDNVLLSLHRNFSRYGKAKTANTIIKRLFSASSSIIYVDTGMGYGYYGYRGMILNDRFEPLVICGYIDNNTSSDFTYEYPLCLISPRVFSNDDVVSKSVVRKIIPYYSTYPDDSLVSMSNNIKILISDDIDDIITKPVEPMEVNVNNKIYWILTEHFDDLEL